MVSVIVVNYNGQRFLEKSFTSLAQQTYPNVEILCVDSGSSDGSVDFVRENFPNVRLLPRQNRGFGAACNLGVREAKGEYVFFLNEDMHVPPDYIANLVQTYLDIKKRDEKIGALGTSQYTYEGQPRPLVRVGKIDLLGYPAPIAEEDAPAAFLPGCPFFIQRKIFLESGGFSPHIFMYNDDTDLCWRLALMGYHQYCASRLYLYHYDAASMPGFPPKKIYYFVTTTLVCIFNNYSLVFLPFFLVLNLLFTLLVILPGLVIVSRGDFAYAQAVWQGIWDFCKKIPSMWAFRKSIQDKRLISDFEFLRRYGRLAPSLLAGRAYRRMRYPTRPMLVKQDMTVPR